MADWVSIDLNSLPFAGEVDSLATPIEVALEAAATAADLSSALLSGPLSTLAEVSIDYLGAARGLIDSLIEPLITSGAFALVIRPDLFDKNTAPRGLDGFLRVIKQAMNDPGDTNRPQFSVGSTSSGVIFMLSSPSLDGISSAAVALQSLFGAQWTDLVNFANADPVTVPVLDIEATGSVTALVPEEAPERAFVDASQSLYSTQPNFDPYKAQQVVAMTGRNIGNFARIESFDNSTKTFRLNPGFRYQMEVGDLYAISRNTKPSPPDWETVRLADAVPVVGDIVEALATARDSMAAYGSQYDRLRTLLTAKADSYRMLATEIAALSTQLDAFSSIGTISVLPVEPQSGGNNGFIREMFDGGNVPPVGSSDYTIGVVLYGGSGFIDVVRKIFPV